MFLSNIWLVIFNLFVSLKRTNVDIIHYWLVSRLRRIRSREESVLDSATTRKELNPNTEIRPDVFSTLRKSRPQRQIETLQKPFQTKTHESQPSLQQQRSRHPIKRLKVRSIGSTYEVDDNEVHEIIHESIPEVHDEGPIYIKPVVRVMKKNIFDSILDILQQLLDPPKKGTGPIVGPIKMPGSKRKIYLRLLEPVDSSHINVRFVTQIPVPVVDEESILSREHESVLPFLPFVDPDATFLNRHPTSDATLSSSNRHHSIQLPRNASHVSSKDRRLQPKPATKLKRPSENFKETDNVSPVKVEAASGAESEKNHLYYQYQTENDAVRTVTEIIKDATENKQGPKDSLEPWYQLTTHRLPLRQIAPLYPLSAMEHDSGPYENTYKVPSDSLTVPGTHSSSYEQYSNVNAGASTGVYDQSSSYTIPNVYQKPNEFSPSSYPISYQNQNEYNNAPSSTSYIKQNDLFIAPTTTHTSSYEKPANVPLPSSSSYATSHAQNDVQTSSSSQSSALRVIDPPLYPFLDPRKVPENHHANQVLQYHPRQQQPYNLPNVNEIDSMLRNHAENGDQVTWGKLKREKNELNFQKSVEVTSDENREKWQPLMLVSEDADWHKAFANLAKVANSGNQHETVARQQSINRPRQASGQRNTLPDNTIETGKVDQRGDPSGGKRRNYSAASIRNAKCSPSDKRCGRTETTMSHPGDTIKIADEQTRSEPIVITPKSLASNTVEMSRSNVTTKSGWIEEPQPLVMTTEILVTSGTTESPPLLIKVMKNTTVRSIDKKITTSGSMTNNIMEKLAASNATERSSIDASKMAIPRNNTMRRLQLPKRPMIMKKPIFVLKEMESSRMVASSTTRRPTIASTTEKTKATKRWTFRSEISKAKSSTTW